MICTSLITFAAILATSYSNPIDSCVVNNNAYRQGEIFTLPGLTSCIKYRCDHNVALLVDEGCELNEMCYDVGSTWVKDCRTYRCTKTVQADSSKYSISLESSQCRDAYGSCHNPGQIFHYQVNGVTYKQCTCSDDSKGKLRYSCSG